MDNYYGYEPYEKPKSGFGKGVLTGVLSTLLVVFMATAATIGVHGIREYLSGSNTPPQETTAAREPGKETVKAGGTKDGAVNYTGNDELLNQIVNRLSEIKGYVDEEYLFDYEEQQLADGAYMGFLYGLGDPYAYYYNEEEFAALQDSYSGEYYGIGVLVQQDPENREVTILRVFDGPAKEAGIQKGDILYRVEELMVSEEDLNTVIARIKGDEGTTVNVEVYRKETEEYMTFDVERRQVVSEDVEYRMLTDRVGYVLLDQFEGKAAEQIKAAIADMEAQGMEGLVLDLRDNPGGDLDVMLDIADIFLPRGVVLTIEDVKGHSVPYYSGGNSFGKPLVVLVNENSASASEALSGAVKDHGVGTLVGTQTFGKGIVQSIYPLRGGKTGMKLTTAHYYTPGGTCIHGTGITPDVIVELEEGEADNQLAEALAIVEEALGDQP